MPFDKLRAALEKSKAEEKSGPRNKVAGKFNSEQYGGYGEMVITEACGASSTGSIPVSHPTKTPLNLRGVFLTNGSIYCILWAVFKPTIIEVIHDSGSDS